MLILILLFVVLPCVGLAIDSRLRWWKWCCRMADEKAKEGVK